MRQILKNKWKTNGGAAMLVGLVFFIFISVATVSGLVSPSAREFKNASINLNSKKSYFLSESGSEDALYRILNNLSIDSSETITLDGNQATTSITTIGSNEKEIESLGDVSNYERRSKISLETDVGVTFNYGVQVGEGGLSFIDGTINGNVYANGPISGDSSTTINGTAVSANSPSSQYSDQSNGFGTPAYNVVFGNNNATQDIAQSFQVSTSTIALSKVQFYIKKTGTPSDATVKIVNNSGSDPGTTVLASGTLSASNVTTNYGWVEVSFTSNPFLNTGTTYWLMIDASTSSTKYYTIGASSSTYGNGLGKIGRDGNSWNNTTPSGLDYYFNLYLGGIQGIIYSTAGQWNPIPITGNARAHFVTYTNVTGTIYCQVGTLNNKACDTSQADPVYESLPVSDANITSWKDEALAGGTYSGNYSVGWQGATLGPQKIGGNLIVSGGSVLTVSGTLWVTGNLTLDGGGTIQLASSYGSNDAVIVVDGTITISGGGHATGSGTSGSYLMLLSMNSSSSAISVSGGAGAVIVYAHSGTVSITGGASLKEVTGYALSIDGNSTVTYESGLANNNFSTGPSGSWTVEDWREVE